MKVVVNGKRPDAFLRGCYDYLRRSERYDVEFGRAWAKRTLRNKGGGVYLVFEDGKPAYVGESSFLEARLAEIGSIHNHPLPRHVVARHSPKLWRKRKKLDRREFSTAASRKAREWMEAHMRVAYIELPLGRAELEEYIVPRLDKKRRYNSPAKRGSTQKGRLNPGESHG